MDHNIADLTNNVYQNDNNSCEFDYQSEQLYFEMKDKHHTFCIGVKDLLTCLEFAIDQGELPKLPFGWWADVKSRYDMELYTDEEET